MLDGDMRAIIFHGTIYDVQSSIYTHITIIFEFSAAGLISGSKMELMPFTLPLFHN